MGAASSRRKQQWRRLAGSLRPTSGWHSQVIRSYLPCPCVRGPAAFPSCIPFTRTTARSCSARHPPACRALWGYAAALLGDAAALFGALVPTARGALSLLSQLHYPAPGWLLRRTAQVRRGRCCALFMPVVAPPAAHFAEVRKQRDTAAFRCYCCRCCW